MLSESLDEAKGKTLTTAEMISGTVPNPSGSGSHLQAY